MQLPKRQANLAECQDKTVHHQQLFDLEDRLFQHDFKLLELKAIKSRLSQSVCLFSKDQNAFDKNWKQLMKYPVFFLHL